MSETLPSKGTIIVDCPNPDHMDSVCMICFNGKIQYQICVVDGETRVIDRYGVPTALTEVVPPAWLIELTEDCVECVEEGATEMCGRPAVQVWMPGIPPTWAYSKDGGPIWQAATQDADDDQQAWWSWPGTVEHILPVVSERSDAAGVMVNQHGDVWLDLEYTEETKDDPPIPLDTTVTPGQYVALVRLETS